jgi:hypothetical protein
MSTVIGAVLLRPFLALGLFLVAAMVAWPIRRLPDSALKRFLLMRF